MDACGVLGWVPGWVPGWVLGAGC